MKHPIRKFILIFLCTVLVGCLALGVIFVGAVFGFWGNVNDIDIDSLTLRSNTHIVYIDPESGEEKPLLTLSAEENRVWVDLDATPKNLQNAIISIEDERFPTHKGVDLPRTAKATLTYIVDKLKPGSSGASFGGSTITQQLIKNITGDDDQTPARKIREISQAIALEKKMSKDQILELYMNCIYLSQGCNGVQTAANLFFDKDVSLLNLAECASLAGITQNPSYYDPFINPDKNKERQEMVLAKMLELDYITQAEYDEAINYELHFADSSRKVQENDAITSYYVDQVVRDVLRDLQKKGYSESLANRMLYSGGLKVYAAYNPRIQEAVETYYKDTDHFPDPEAQSAIVVMDPSTGQIVGMAGGIGEKVGRFTLNRAAQSPRQPGSTIKPIAVYAPALDSGVINTGSTFKDSRKSYNGWTPRNYSYTYSDSYVSINYALRQSLNTVPVEILSKMGAQASYDFLTQKLGMTTLVESEDIGGQVFTDLGYSQLALGGLTHGATVLEMTAAYCPFANGGIYNTPYTYTEVLDSKGANILKSNGEGSSWEAMKPSTAYIMAQYLQEVVSAGTGRGAALSGIDTAGKTGTTSDNNDRWFIGFTPYYVAAVWYGYDIPEEINMSSNPCIPVWRNIMSTVHKGVDGKKEFSRPTGLVYASYCSESGLKPTSSCPVSKGYFTPGAEPTEYCNLKHTNTRSSGESTGSGGSNKKQNNTNDEDEDDTKTGSTSGGTSGTAASPGTGGSNSSGSGSTTGGASSGGSGSAGGAAGGGGSSSGSGTGGGTGSGGSGGSTGSNSGGTTGGSSGSGGSGETGGSDNSTTGAED